jgi:putative ABC transport system ATP-binding protein
MNSTTSTTLSASTATLETVASLEQDTARQTQPMVVAEKVSKVYEGGDTTRVVGLRGINLTIQRGEFVAVVGPSGSGKSTLLNVIAGIDRPTEGRIEVDGLDLAALRTDELADFRRNTVGLVFQLFNLVPVLSAIENVKLPLIPYAPKTLNLDRRARELLAQVGLGERMHHLPSQLSGGEQQRVAVARALVNRPRLLLADEPTGNLDSKSGGELMDLFTELHSQYDMTVITVTHDPNIAGRAERVLELRDGALLLPKGDTVLQPDDEVIALANRENEEAFREMMTGD